MAADSRVAEATHTHYSSTADDYTMTKAINVCKNTGLAFLLAGIPLTAVWLFYDDQWSEAMARADAARARISYSRNATPDASAVIEMESHRAVAALSMPRRDAFGLATVVVVAVGLFMYPTAGLILRRRQPEKGSRGALAQYLICYLLLLIHLVILGLPTLRYHQNRNSSRSAHALRSPRQDAEPGAAADGGSLADSTCSAGHSRRR